MKVFHRVYLYLARNKGKTGILLAMLTVICTLALLCISVGNAAEDSLTNLRETMGGYFNVKSNMQQGYFEFVNDEMVQRIMDSGNIRSYNGQDIRYVMADDLELEPGRFTADGDRKAKLARVFGNTDSSLNEYFVLGYYVIDEGRHITPDDKGKALISDVLAKRNNLSVGDMFSMRMNDENIPEERKEEISSHTAEVAGIYHIETAVTMSSSDSAECDIEENFIFTDTAFVREIYEDLRDSAIKEYTDGASFFVKDPKELNKIVEELSSISEYDWEMYEVTKNNKAYEDSAVPLERLSGLVSIMVFVIILISMIVLSLVLFLWMRDRVHEIGIYLSIGIKKTGILWQHMLENFMAALIAFLIAVGITMAASGVAERAVSDSFFAEADEESEALADIQIKVGMKEAAEIAGMGILLTLLATGVSSVTILRMQPKDILSKMS